MTFDPAKHKFGMAYKSTINGSSCYPIGVQVNYEDEINNPFVVCPDDDDCGYLPADKLTRSPEHDLIPRAVVEERLRELDEEWKRRADKMAKALHECEYKARLQSQLNDGAGIMQDICIIVDEALSEYKKAIGE